ncbi:F0F1 ATP synthase subunit B [Anaerostipes sp. MSJ-23]|uniref:F0F1 ATP synthase subunit B n=1 Tax=unclassified Anaerostipes TaxID=2635253 RepID=UPI001C116E82|nr:F0F1 ATP synthase subunit B [Anaerostipes sp. MSJ-23]
MDGRIFGLDIQLGFDVIFEAIAILIMFVLLSYLLFEPVRKILEDRKKKVAGQLDQAQKDQEEAARLRAEYEGKIKNIEKEADEILTQARKKALKREEEIVQEAKEEAARRIARADHEIELQKAKVQDQMKKEMVQVAVMMAGKIIAEKITEEEQDSLVDATLKEMGDQTWLQK